MVGFGINGKFIGMRSGTAQFPLTGSRNNGSSPGSGPDPRSRDMRKDV